MQMVMPGLYFRKASFAEAGRGLHMAYGPWFAHHWAAGSVEVRTYLLWLCPLVLNLGLELMLQSAK